MGQGQFGPHHLQTPPLILSSAYALTFIHKMSPFRRQSAISLQSTLTEVLISELFSIDGIVSSAFQEETFGPPAFPTHHLLPSFEDDHLGPPPTQSGDGERVNFLDFAANICDLSFGARPEDMYAIFPLFDVPIDHHDGLQESRPCAPGHLQRTIPHQSQHLFASGYHHDVRGASTGTDRHVHPPSLHFIFPLADWTGRSFDHDNLPVLF